MHPGRLFFNARFGLKERYIGPGEWYASSENIIISTVLGSCIAVVLFEPLRAGGGLNHFMLPGLHDRPGLKPPEMATGTTGQGSGGFYTGTARYGVNAMELLINDCLKLGLDRKRLRAKVFGGSKVLGLPGGARSSDSQGVGDQNIAFIKRFLADEHIPVEAWSVGGYLPRRIYYFSQTGKVLMKYSYSQAIGPVARRERRYAHKLDEQSSFDGSATVFHDPGTE